MPCAAERTTRPPGAVIARVRSFMELSGQAPITHSHIVH